MNSIRKDIMQFFVAQFKRINRTTDTTIGAPRSPYTFNKFVGTVKDRFLYLDQINDFPTICLYDMTERRTHIGSGIKFGTFTLTIRGYIKEADPILAAEDLAEDIEYVVNTWTHLKSDTCPLLLEDVRVASLQTDEGLFEPYGLCQVRAEVFYQIPPLV